MTQPPYAWRISIDGEIRTSFAGTLIQAKRHARDLINRDMMAQDVVNEMAPTVHGSASQSAIEEKTPPGKQVATAICSRQNCWP